MLRGQRSDFSCKSSFLLLRIRHVAIIKLPSSVRMRKNQNNEQRYEEEQNTMFKSVKKSQFSCVSSFFTLRIRYVSIIKGSSCVYSCVKVRKNQPSEQRKRGSEYGV